VGFRIALKDVSTWNVSTDAFEMDANLGVSVGNGSKDVSKMVASQ
jgi:hypothetical protein